MEKSTRAGGEEKGRADSLFDLSGDVSHDASLDKGLEDLLGVIRAVVVVHRYVIHACRVVKARGEERKFKRRTARRKNTNC